MTEALPGAGFRPLVLSSLQFKIKKEKMIRKGNNVFAFQIVLSPFWLHDDI
jgi:hypothetical protein